ncbi:MAG: tetratricopeptide repeat protein [Elusimicrobiaceae bacterium]
MKTKLLRKAVVLLIALFLVFVGFKYISFYYMKKGISATDNAEKVKYFSKSAAMLNDQSRLLRAMTYIEMKRYDDALVDLLYTVKHHSEYPVTYLYLGNVYYELNKDEEALKAYDSALKLMPDYIAKELGAKSATKTLAETYGMTSSQVADNLTVKLYLDRAASLAKLKRFADSFTDVEKAREVSPADPYVYLARSKIYEMMNDKKNSVKDYNTAFALRRQAEEQMEKMQKQIAEKIKENMEKIPAAPAK